MTEIQKVVLSLVAGALIASLAFLLIGDSKEVIIVEPDPKSEELIKADSLAIVVDSLKVIIKEDSVVFAELKTNHRDEINSIDSLSIHNIYLLWSGQRADSADRQFGTAGGLYK